MSVLFRSCAIALVALLAAGCATTPQFAELAREAEGRLLAFGSQRVLVLRGTSYEMGRQHGRLLSEGVRTVITEGLAWTGSAGLGRDKLAAIFAQLEPHIPQHYKDEMRGLAEGSGVPLRDIQLLHAMPSRFHCSGAAVARSMTRDGKLYHSRSLDYSLDIGVADRMQNHALVIARFPNDAAANAVPAWAGFLGSVTGMNANGISVGEKGAASNDESFAGMPMIFTVREVLRRAKTLDQALTIFEAGPRTCGFNFIVGSGDERSAAALGVTRHHFHVSRMGDPAENVGPHRAMRDTVRRTNHFIGKDLAKTQPRRLTDYHPKNYLKGSWERYRTISEFLAAHRGKLDAPSMIALLRRYPPKHPCLHQAVMCATDRTIWISQAVDDRTTPHAGAQNQVFHGYRLTERAILPTGTTPQGTTPK